MRVLRLLGLLPILIGVAFIIIAAAHPDAIENHVCGVARMVVARMVVDVPEACFRGAPVWLAMLSAAALIGIGLAWSAFWGRPPADAARLSVKGLRLHQYPPQRAQTTNFCRMRVHNRGPAPAINVKIHLLNIEPPPRHTAWAGNYPYPVARAGQPIDASGCEIQRGGDELFQVASGWKDSHGEFMAGLDTKSPFHNPTPIAPDERWQMTYEVAADNAAPVQFLLEMFVKNGAVAMKRKTGRGPRVGA